GADILRLWVASCDYSEDVRISEEIIAQVAESYRKIRNTFRYLLANLYDFNPPRDTQPLDSLFELDRWALQRLQRVSDEVTQAYDGYQFHQAFRAIYHACVFDLSAFYLDALKDRLYTESSDSRQRRCAQTVLYAILRLLVKMLAPILAMTTDEVWRVMRGLKLVDSDSVHLADWPASVVQIDEARERRWERFLAVREVVMKALEEQRIAQVIGSPLEARVTLIAVEDELRQLLETHRQTLAEAFVVSEVCVATAGGSAAMTEASVSVTVERAPGAKCQRCWKYCPSVGTDHEHPQLCDRCVEVVRHNMSSV
ncbi:MAG: class I tRNA ligase family protein, partial [Candidatus Omnitrophica bacterium]|nr:class I tRNA ligase family protein [Candidatus Omnitrophota bacterium]